MVPDNMFAGEIQDFFSNFTRLYELDMSWDSLQGINQLGAFDHETVEKLRVTTCVTKTKLNSDLVLKVIIPTSSFIVLVCALCLVCAVITQKKRETIKN